MSDFDNILHDRLNEETQFAGMEQNWQKLSQRLDQPPPPSSGGGFWPFAGALALLLLLASGLWFWRSVSRLSEENRSLRESVNALEINALRKADTVFVSKVIVQTDTIYRTVYSIEKLRGGVFSKLENTQPSDVLKNSEAFDSSNQPVSEIFQTAGTSPKTVFAEGKNPGAAKTEFEKPKTVGAAAGPTAQNPIAKNEETENVPSEKSKTPFPEDLKAKTEMAENGEVQKSVQPVENQAIAANDSTQVANLENPGRTFSKPDSTTAIKQDSILKNEQTAIAEAPKKDDFDASVGAVPIKKLRKNTFGLRDFSLGGQFTSGIAPVKGTQPLSGGGLTAELKFASNFRLSLTADFYKLKYDGAPRTDKIGLPEAPVHGPTGLRFQQAQITQKRQQVGLRVQYLFPTYGEWQPYVSLGYVWQRLDKQDVEFTFTNPVNQNRVKITKPAPAQTFSKTWSAGFGVERQIGKITLGASADFQQSFGSKKTLNLPVFRLGGKFNF